MSLQGLGEAGSGILIVDRLGPAHFQLVRAG